MKKLRKFSEKKVPGLHENMRTERDMRGSGVKLFPRCKGPITKGRSPMLLNFETVADLFGRPQCEAALELGISITTLKQVRCQTQQMLEVSEDAGDNDMGPRGRETSGR